jgi:hypothetical protein
MKALQLFLKQNQLMSLFLVASLGYALRDANIRPSRLVSGLPLILRTLVSLQ